MSKELKALKRIENFMSQNAVHWKQDIAMIETALERLEQYDNTLKEYGCVSGDLNYFLTRIFTKLEQIGTALDKLKKDESLNLDYDVETNNKKLKALEVIKEKKVAINILFMSANAYVYNQLYAVVIIPSGTTPKYEWKLTETEFDTIKEALK
jgi:hypothetical protein